MYGLAVHFVTDNYLVLVSFIYLLVTDRMLLELINWRGLSVEQMHPTLLVSLRLCVTMRLKEIISETGTLLDGNEMTSRQAVYIMAF